jgi:uronate dehydrogenase
MRRVVITGAAGRLGAEVTSRLRAAGHSVRGIDRIDRSGDPDHVVADLNDGDVIENALSADDVLVHLASVHPFSRDPETSEEPSDSAYISLNMGGTWHLYSAAARAGVRQVVLTSSIAAARPTRDFSERIDESTTDAPWGAYGISKWFQEGVARTFAASHGISSLILRPPAFVDVDPLQDGYSYATGALSLDDVIDVHEKAIEAVVSRRLLSGVGEVPVYALGNELPFGPEDSAFLDLADRLPLLEKYWPGAERWFRERGFDPRRGLNLHPQLTDIRPAVRDLGWRPQMTFARWFREHVGS